MCNGLKSAKLKVQNKKVIGGCVRAVDCDWWMCASAGLWLADVFERWAVIGGCVRALGCDWLTHRRSSPRFCQIFSMILIICSVSMSCRRSASHTDIRLHRSSRGVWRRVTAKTHGSPSPFLKMISLLEKSSSLMISGFSQFNHSGRLAEDMIRHSSNLKHRNIELKLKPEGFWISLFITP